MTDLAQLLPLLSCPRCRGGLRSRTAVMLVCEGCRHTYGIENGVPILFDPKERRTIEHDYGSAAQMRGEYHASPLARIRKFVKRALGSTRRLPIHPRVGEVQSRLADDWTLEVGSGTKRPGARRVQLDIGMFPGVDVIGSGCRLPFRDESFALVRSLAVLEHVREPQLMIAEMLRVVRPGGYIYTEIPFLQHFHAYPNDFQRLTQQGLRQAFAGCEVIAEGIVAGPSSAITALLADYFELWTFSQRRWLNDIARTIPLLLLWPLKFLDHLLVKNPRAHEVSSGLYLLSQKPLATPVRQLPTTIDSASLNVSVIG